MEWGAFFDGEAVGGQVFHIKRQDGLDIALPVGQRFAGEAVHEVDTDIADACLAQQPYGLRHLGSGVAATQEVQALVFEGLCPHGDAVDTEPL